MNAKRSFLSSDWLRSRLDDYVKTKAPSTFVEMVLAIEQHVLDLNGHHQKRAELVVVTRAWLKAFGPTPDPAKAAVTCRKLERAETRGLMVKEAWGWLAEIAEKSAVQDSNNVPNLGNTPTKP
jgi:hypothetical protein